jgi:hypothetical protein
MVCLRDRSFRSPLAGASQPASNRPLIRVGADHAPAPRHSPQAGEVYVGGRSRTRDLSCREAARVGCLGGLFSDEVSAEDPVGSAPGTHVIGRDAVHAFSGESLQPAAGSSSSWAMTSSSRLAPSALLARLASVPTSSELREARARKGPGVQLRACSAEGRGPLDPSPSAFLAPRVRPICSRQRAIYEP